MLTANVFGERARCVRSGFYRVMVMYQARLSANWAPVALWRILLTGKLLSGGLHVK